MSDKSAYLWWQRGVIYQIYPRSFQDSNHDGVGDIPGIISRLDYLEWLGIDAIWLSPIFPSPMADFGYDVADYTSIDPLFGTMQDFAALLTEVHARGMKLILDFVPNHSSDEHPWFLESRSSRTSPKRDWYIWRDPAPDGGVPNNWQSYFGGPAWTLDETTGQYYLHLFDPKQADLNWRNPDVRSAMYDVLRFWFEQGVDGFRIDVIWLLIKDEHYRDNPPNPYAKPDEPWLSQIRIYNEDQPEVHTVIREMRTVFDAYPERVMIGEIYLPFERLMLYYGEKLDGVQLPFNFSLPLLNEWTATAVKDLVNSYESMLPDGGWPNWVLGNHDQPRVASRIGQAQASIAQMLLLTLRGTPTCYYGDEIGMEDGDIPLERVVDPQAIRSGYHAGRDPERTPMQWDDAPYAGFSTAPSWLPVASGYDRRNVVQQRDDRTSLLNLVRLLIQIRRNHPTLIEGSYRSLQTEPDDVFAYLRASEDQRLLVALNFGSTSHELDLSSVGTNGTLLCSTFMDYTGAVVLAHLILRPHEGMVIVLES